MERDIKVGLVLGILLVALVAVLFFRRAPHPEEKLAALQEADPRPDELPVVRTRTEPYRIPPEYVKSILGERLGIPVSGQKPEAAQSARSPAPAALRGKDSTTAAAAHLANTPPSDSELATPTALANVSTVAQAPPPPVMPRRPVPGQRYVVRAGDTLASIAREAYGDEAKYRVIFEANRDRLVSADELPVGLELRIPSNPDRTEPSSRPEKKTARHRGSSDIATEQSRVYVVQPGETLRAIARKVYGRESMYRAILRANRDKLGSPGDIHPGMRLVLP